MFLFVFFPWMTDLSGEGIIAMCLLLSTHILLKDSDLSPGLSQPGHGLEPQMKASKNALSKTTLRMKHPGCHSHANEAPILFPKPSRQICNFWLWWLVFMVVYFNFLFQIMSLLPSSHSTHLLSCCPFPHLAFEFIKTSCIHSIVLNIYSSCFWTFAFPLDFSFGLQPLIHFAFDFLLVPH